MGLTPRHDVPLKKRDWKYLDSLLKANIDKVPTSRKKAEIFLPDYEMKPDEIKAELKKNGYNYKDNANDSLQIF
ncbi:hypothetical protein [Lacticaseibacillus paracasei]|uniref:Putative aspartate/tyrosine/aromatic aminotransferase n=1 Tax=Lacticaseibacillus paracasei (strain ATCC 334 / BCRC 17002 / CCUG 31169 / CIP 107868 / KCTC 3260 / NRRL B-441) TaxID=321967 RepID=Q037C6_LACP3|nr:hypothetical protein [Lacticaseibacillus paracasei]ABD83388.1 putative aspartate/tyrosine/aromatic aminotransferase [Lacticaseibacillus paracasei ATCC 334]ABJ70696.1 hypothetical protein LSEI_1938 [Lacticaseibacillus paracasei ATCC 334]OSY80051.1 hypothetical protein BLW95_09310 [Lacticaseibacillus paracasei]